jgi:hypothetical protein
MDSYGQTPELEGKKPFPFKPPTADDDPYLNPSPLGSGGHEMIFRIRDGDVSVLSDEEAEIERERRHPKKVTKRPRVYPRGNRCL